MKPEQLLQERCVELERKYPGALPVLVNLQGQRIAEEEAMLLLNGGTTIAWQAWTEGGSCLGGVIVDARECAATGDVLTMVGDSGAIYELHDGYIIRRGEAGKILGRCSGHGPGTGWYQLAAQPYDERSVPGFRGLWSAFTAAIAVLDARHMAESGST